MKFTFQIANRFTILGMMAVVIAAMATAVAFLWQEFLTLRYSQTSYLGSVALAGQMELNRQALSDNERSGSVRLTWENETLLRMRVQTVDVPPAIEQLGIPALVAAGFQALLFDAPGHGLSGPSRLGARQSSFKDFAAGIRALEAAGPLHGLVAHSGGAIAAGLAKLAPAWMPMRMKWCSGSMPERRTVMARCPCRAVSWKGS